MTKAEVLQTFERFQYKADEREPPDEYRRRQFRAGWGNAARGREYGRRTLARLTWNNLGYRFGQPGSQSREEMDRVFHVLAEQYERAVAT